jgi:chromosome segregation ATPase
MDEPDRPEILERLNARLNELVQQLLEISNHEPELAGHIPGYQSEVLTLNARVTELGEQTRRLENQKALELEPLQLQVEALEKQLRTKNEEIKELEKKTEPMIKSLGYLVDTARPDSEALREEYNQLDAIYKKLADTTQERTEIVTNLESLDKEASRNFYLLILLGVVVLVVGILLITGVL